MTLPRNEVAFGISAAGAVLATERHNTIPRKGMTEQEKIFIGQSAESAVLVEK